MNTLFLQIILAIDIATLTWLFLLFGERRVNYIFGVREMKLLMGLTQGVIVIDHQHHIKAMNEEALQMFPSNQADESMSIIDRLPFFDGEKRNIRAKDHPFYLALRHKHSIAPSRRWIKKGDDFVPVSVSVAFVPASKGASLAVVGLIRDVSNEELMERMKADFIGIASHQLRSPLASLKWYGEIFTKNMWISLPLQEREYLNRMNIATNRMIALVDDFLVASRLETNAQPTHVDRIFLKNLLQHIIETQDLFIKAKKITVHLSQTGSIKPVYADPAMLREVLANFVSNAVKYNRNSGKIFIQIRLDSTDIGVCIRDTGLGIPLDQQSQVFTKFFRADNAVTQGFKGTGLGLYTAKLILEQMHGSVRFESVFGQGTTFWVTFPRDQRKK